MKETCHSEYSNLLSVYLKPVKNAFRSEKELEEQWETLKYLSKPDFEISLKEYEEFILFLTSRNIQYHFFPENDKSGIDSIYCRDASIATNFGMIICNMGKKGRIYEPKAHKELYKKNEIKVLGEIKSPGTLEGGDVAWLDEKTLAVGRSYRTNEDGIRQLKKILTPKGVSVVKVELPHYKGEGDVFHLMSILSPIDKDLAVVYSNLMPITFREELLIRGFKLIEVPEEEVDSMGCNVLAVAPRICLMLEGNPITKKLLENAGCLVFTYKGDEISLKGGGGPSCLTRPMKRKI